MGEPLVSVIIPTFNRAYCLPRTLDSALQQTHRNVELVITDDGSTDGTEALVAEYAKKHRIVYRYQTNQGVSAARNRALEVASGDYVALLDSDDVWKPWKLELQLACLSRRPELGMVWTDMEALDPAGNVFSPRHIRTMYSAYGWFTLDKLFSGSTPLADIAPSLAENLGAARFHHGYIYSQMMMGNLVHTSTVLMTRERLERVKGFNEELHVAGEDYDFHLRTCKAGPVGFIDLPTIQYQRGMPDRLGEYSVMIATNLLKTILPIFRTEQLDLPQSMIDAALAEAYEFLGSAHLNRGERGPALRALLTSLRYKPLQPAVLKSITLATLPPVLTELLRKSYRRFQAD